MVYKIQLFFIVAIVATIARPAINAALPAIVTTATIATVKHIIASVAAAIVLTAGLNTSVIFNYIFRFKHVNPLNGYKYPTHKPPNV